MVTLFYAPTKILKTNSFYLCTHRRTAISVSYQLFKGLQQAWFLQALLLSGDQKTSPQLPEQTLRMFPAPDWLWGCRRPPPCFRLHSDPITCRTRQEKQWPFSPESNRTHFSTIQQKMPHLEMHLFRSFSLEEGVSKFNDTTSCLLE